MPWQRDHLEFLDLSFMLSFIVGMPIQKQEMERLHQFAAANGYDVALKPWDIAYWKKQERDTVFGYAS